MTRRILGMVSISLCLRRSVDVDVAVTTAGFEWNERRRRKAVTAKESLVQSLKSEHSAPVDTLGLLHIHVHSLSSWNYPLLLGTLRTR